MERDPIANDARQARQRRKLGPDPACTLCSTANTAVLIAARVSLIERHHVVGRTMHPDLTVPLCRNCHAVQTASQLAQGVELRHDADRSLLDMIADVLAQLGAFLAAVGEWLVTLAERLREFCAVLDRNGPEWRQWPEART